MTECSPAGQVSVADGVGRADHREQDGAGDGAGCVQACQTGGEAHGVVDGVRGLVEDDAVHHLAAWVHECGDMCVVEVPREGDGQSDPLAMRSQLRGG